MVKKYVCEGEWAGRRGAAQARRRCVVSSRLGGGEGGDRQAQAWALRAGREF